MMRSDYWDSYALPPHVPCLVENSGSSDEEEMIAAVIEAGAKEVQRVEEREADKARKRVRGKERRDRYECGQ